MGCSLFSSYCNTAVQHRILRHILGLLISQIFLCIYSVSAPVILNFPSITLLNIFDILHAVELLFAALAVFKFNLVTYQYLRYRLSVYSSLCCYFSLTYSPAEI